MVTPYFLPFEYPARKHNRIRRVWVAPVASKQEGLWGTLVALLQLPEDTANPDAAAATLCDLFTKLYYPSSVIRKITTVQAKDREIHFDEMLQELNTAFQNPERFGIPASEPSAFDVLLGIIHAEAVYFASHRHQEIWFLKRFDPSEKEEERLNNISDTSNKGQFFSSVISGTLQGGETLVLASSEFFTIWNHDTVVHLIDTAKSTEELVATLHTLAKQKDIRQEASSLFILGLDPEVEEEVGVVVSVSPLMRTTVRGLWLGTKWSGRNLLKMVKNWRGAVNLLTAIVGRILEGLAMIWSGIRTIILLISLGITVMVGMRNQQDALAGQLRLEPFARWIRLTNRLLKGVSAATVLVLLLATTMATRIQYERGRQEERNRASEIEQKAIQAKAGLIYGNDRDAQRLLEEARGLLKELPARENDPSHQKIVSDLESVAKQLRHEIELGAPTVDIAAPAGSQRIALNQNVLLAVAPTAVGVFDAASLKAKPIPRIVPLPPKTIQNINSAEMPSTQLVLIHDEGKIHRVVVSKPTSLTTVATPEQVSDVRTTYNGRLYAVDNAATTIVRLSPAGKGWGKPEPWLASGSTSVPTNPRFMLVDGSVYVAAATSVYKYYRGAQEPFVFSIEPPLDSPISFQLVGSSPSLLLVDRRNRIIVVNKGEDNKENGGKVRAQLIHSGWKNLKDAVIDTKAKTVTVLADDRIQQFQLPAF